jgi:hypothetical protein
LCDALNMFCVTHEIRLEKQLSIECDLLLTSSIDIYEISNVILLAQDISIMAGSKYAERGADSASKN